MLKIVKLFLPVEEKKFENRDAEKLRGYFGNYFQEHIEFHHHIDEFKFLYTSSKIQYKIIDGCAMIMGIGEVGDLLLSLAEKIQEFKINEEIFKTIPEIKINFPKLEVNDKKYSYKFETLWFALNQENYLKYKKGEFDLNKQLANNILEFFKMCKIQADKKIEVNGNFKPVLFQQKGTSIIGFSGEFQTNVDLPDDISLGKRKSIGLGRIKKIKNKEGIC